MITLDLLPNMPINVDDRTAALGGSFWYDPLRVYAPIPLQWCYDRLIAHNPAVLLDIGASTGCYTLLAAHHPALTVHAFEPVSEVADTLRENVRLNGIEACVTVHGTAVSDKIGEQTFHVVKGGSVALSMLGGRPTHYKDYDDVLIPVTTVDEFCQWENLIPTVIKIDTEGNELAVLRGAARVVEKHHPDLIVEWSDINTDQYGYHPREIEALLTEWGYTFTNEDGNDLLCVWRGYAA